MLYEQEFAALNQFFLENDYTLLVQYENEDPVAFDLIFFDILLLLSLRLKGIQIKFTKKKKLKKPLEGHFKLKFLI